MIAINSLPFSENMLEGRNTYPIGMGALGGLVELLWIAEQHQSFGCVGHREHISKGHLGGFVNE